MHVLRFKLLCGGIPFAAMVRARREHHDIAVLVVGSHGRQRPRSERIDGFVEAAAAGALPKVSPVRAWRGPGRRLCGAGN